MRFQCKLFALWVLSALGQPDIQISKSVQAKNATTESFRGRAKKIAIPEETHDRGPAEKRHSGIKGSLPPKTDKEITHHWKKAQHLPKALKWQEPEKQIWREEAIHHPKTTANKKHKEGFPYWILILLFPLICAIIMSMTCFVVYMKEYNKTKKEDQEISKEEQQKQIQSESIKEVERFCAGLPISAIDKNSRESDDTTGSYKPKVKEGGIGSIMRDPDLDSAAREEAPRTYKMVYKGNKWNTVDKVPSDISFHIPSETFLSAY